MNRLLSLILLFTCLFSHGQTSYLFVKKGLHKVKTYGEEDRIVLQLKNGRVYSGLITHLENNTIYINGAPVNKDSVDAILLGGPKEKLSIDAKTWALVAGGMTLVTGGLLLSKQAKIKEALLAGAAMGLLPIIIAWIKAKASLKRKKYSIGKKYRLQVFDMNMPTRHAF